MDTTITDYLVKDNQIWVEKNNNSKFFHLCSTNQFVAWIREHHEDQVKKLAFDVVQRFLHLENIQKYYEWQTEKLAKTA